MKKKTALEQLIDWMEQNQYFIGNDLYVKQKELLETEREQIEEAYISSAEQLSWKPQADDEVMAQQYYKDTYEWKKS